MSKTITIIQLLNKIANGKEFPKKVKFEDKIYTYYNEMTDYKNEDYFLFDMISDGCVKDFLNDKVEIIEEQEEIDIQDIEPLNAYKLIEAPYMKECLDKNNHTKFCELLKQSELELVDNIKKLGEAVKQLDKNIKEKQ